MQRLGGAFDVEETRVKAAQPFHTPMLGAMTSNRNQLRPTATSSVTVICRTFAPLLLRRRCQPVPSNDGGVTSTRSYRSRTTPQTSANFAFFANDAFDVQSWPLADRTDTLTDLVLHNGFTIGSEF
jgi:hypothetical protein